MSYTALAESGVAGNIARAYGGGPVIPYEVWVDCTSWPVESCCWRDEDYV